MIFEGEELDFTGRILQGFIEASNTNLAIEMAGLMANARMYQSLSQVIRGIDGLIGRSIAEVGRV
jgi:flagellar basal-body rod protein FlgG